MLHTKAYTLFKKYTICVGQFLTLFFNSFIPVSTYHSTKIITFFSVCPFLLSAQTYQKDWVIQLAEEIVEETDFCERCTWVNPTLSEVDFGGERYIFLRYSCSSNESFARMYDLEGTVISECLSVSGMNNCGLGGNAFTIYTFADAILPFWNCSTGFECDFATANNLDREVPIMVDDSRCTEGVKILRAADEFVTYNWEGATIVGNESTLEITEGGTYFITVTDDQGCTFDGEIDIPAIDKLSVKIKGTDQFCAGTNTELFTSGFQSYQWSTGSTDSITTVMEAGTYQVTVTDNQNCEGIANFLLDNYEESAIQIIADLPKVTEGNPVTVFVNNSSTNQPFVTYEWTGNGIITCDDCPSTQYFPQVDNLLNVKVLDGNGCATTASFSMIVETLPAAVYIPNIFRPTSALGNDRLTLLGGPNIQIVESLSIFDRWGNQVFLKEQFLPNDPLAGWDGTFNGELANQDVYTFQAIVLFFNNEQKVFAGDVLLIR